MSKENGKHHISSYASHGGVLLALLTLTFITVAVTAVDFGAWSIGVALLIACAKVFIVLSYFMHLKYENKFTRIMVGSVFGIFALVVIITFIDYLLR